MEIRLNLTPTFVDVSSSVKVQASGIVLNRATNKFSSTVSLTNTSAAALAGPLQYLVQNLPAGVTLANASGSKDGVPYLTVPAGLAAGAQSSFQLQFNNPARVTISYTPAVFSGEF